MKKALALFLIAAGCCVFIWRLTCPALVRVSNGPMAGNRLILVVNPIRSGPAKKSAEELLRLLRTKDTEGASRRFPLLDRRELEDTMIDPPTRWTLDDIVADANGELDFEYLNETASNAMGGYIWIYCMRDKQGGWTVSRFNRVF
jgi:hypothetical protein